MNHIFTPFKKTLNLPLVKDLLRPLFVFQFLIISIPGLSLKAQTLQHDSIRKGPLFIVSYAFQKPAGDMALRFGWNHALGAKLCYKTSKNWILGLAGNFLFGNYVHEPGLLTNITSPDGYFIGSDGHYAEVRLYERGYTAYLEFGKIIPLNKYNKNSGILIFLSPGFLQHKIRIEDTNKSLPALAQNYLPGYDRLSNGFSLSTFIGYIYLSKNQLINFYGGVELSGAWTQNRRLVNFETGLHDGTKRNDYLNGLRIGWILPLYKRAANQFYYN
jgi:hypothetical protein